MTVSVLHASGIQNAAWLLLAFPLAGAAILLLGGKRTNSWGHLVGVAMPILAFAYGVAAFFAMLSYPAGAQRRRDLHLFPWVSVGALNVSIGPVPPPPSVCF